MDVRRPVTHPFRGVHQAGITTRVQDHLHFAAFDVLTDSRDALADVLERWTTAAEQLTSGEPVGRGAVGGDVRLHHRTRDAIEAHLTIVFTALALSREVQARAGLAIRNVVRQLRPLRSATIAINGTRQTFVPAIPAEKQAILDAIHNRKLTH